MSKKATSLIIPDEIIMNKIYVIRVLQNAQNNLPANHPLKKLLEKAGINILLSIAQIAETELSCPVPTASTSQQAA